MKPQYAALLKEVDRLAAKVGHKQRPWLQVIVSEGEDQKPAQEKAVAEWLAAHPKVKARSIDDFDWLIRLVVKWAPRPDTRLPGPPSSNNSDVFAEEERRKRFSRRLHYPASGWV
jgi:hypothetical protein